MSLSKVFTIICILLISVSISAEVPNVINYQGRLTNASGDPVADNAYLVKFIIYDAPTGGTDLWNTGYRTVNTVDGLFTYQLGSLVPLPNGIFSEPNRYLGITVESDLELTPRARFVSAPYTYKAESADNATTLSGELPVYYLDWNNLINVPAGFADGTDSIDTDWNNLTNVPTGFADGVDDGTTYTAGSGLQLIGPEFSIIDGGITSTHLAANSVGASEIASSAVGALEIATGAVGYTEIATGAVRSDEIATDAVEQDKIADNAVRSEHIYPGAVGASEIATGAVGYSEIAAGAVRSDEIATNAVTNGRILDEPGITQNYTTTSTELVYNPIGVYVMNDIITTTIDIPAPGYIFLIAKCYLVHRNTTGNNYAYLQIDEEVNGQSEAPHYNIVGHSAYPSSSTSYRFSVTLTRTYYKSSDGEYTFRLEGNKRYDVGTIYVYQPILTAIYIPTSYGTVNTVASDPNGDLDAQQITITDEEGNTHTGYEIDLRNLELQTKAAQLKAQELELELLKAQQQQNGSQE